MGRGIFCLCSVDNATNWERKMNFTRQNRVGTIFYVIRRVSFCNFSLTLKTSNFQVQLRLSWLLWNQAPASALIKCIPNSLTAARNEANGRPFHHGDPGSISSHTLCGFSWIHCHRACFMVMFRFFAVSFSPQLLWIYSCITELNRFEWPLGLRWFFCGLSLLM